MPDSFSITTQGARYGEICMKFSVRPVLLAASIGLAACSGQPSLSKVDSFVVEACDISWGTEGESKGKWIAPEMQDSESEKPWSASDDTIERLTEIRDGWQRRIVPATSAAQSDETFRPLAEAIKGMLDTTSLVVDLRKSNSYLGPARDGLREYNSQLRTWRIECNATASRLPD